MTVSCRFSPKPAAEQPGFAIQRADRKRLTILCAPGRAAFFTSRYNRANAITNGGAPFPADLVSHATMRHAAGSKTVSIGNWHITELIALRRTVNYTGPIDDNKPREAKLATTTSAAGRPSHSWAAPSRRLPSE